jgi:hypothetical protein
MTEINFGTTFSQLQCKYMNLNYQEALEAILNLPLQTIRVCAYWDEIEQSQNNYSFETLDHIINTTTQANKKIVLAVGMKSPRWPEFHIPQWAKEKYKDSTHQQSEVQDLCHEYTKKVFERYAHNESITHLQVENEPLNSLDVTNGRSISYEFLYDQLRLTTSFKKPHQKILTTNAINIFPYQPGKPFTAAFRFNIHNSDAFGVNVYTKIGIPYGLYVQPFPWFYWKLKEWHEHATSSNTESWITELQSEPWEHGSAVHTKKPVFPSASPSQTEKLTNKLISLGYRNILFWGCEYWYWHKKQGREEWWKKITDLVISRYRTS